jgi:competence transcription factor ComK
VSCTIPNLSSIGKKDDNFLLNPFLERIIFFYNLTTKAGVQFFFNTKSCFYNFEEYLIDRVEKYRNEWYKSEKAKDNPLVKEKIAPPITIPPQTNQFKFESYLVEANKLKQ